MKPVEQEVLLEEVERVNLSLSLHRCLNATVCMHYRPGHEGMQTTTYSIHSLERCSFLHTCTTDLQNAHFYNLSTIKIINC